MKKIKSMFLITAVMAVIGLSGCTSSKNRDDVLAAFDRYNVIPDDYKLVTSWSESGGLLPTIDSYHYIYTNNDNFENEESYKRESNEYIDWNNFNYDDGIIEIVISNYKSGENEDIYKAYVYNQVDLYYEEEYSSDGDRDYSRYHSYSTDSTTYGFKYRGIGPFQHLVLCNENGEIKDNSLSSWLFWL